MKVIKIMMMALVMCSVLTSCSEKQCNCGVVEDDRGDGTPYSIRVKNDCSGNLIDINVDGSKWQSLHKGDKFCQDKIQDSW